MRKGGGKQKGSQFEREVCKRLSFWITHGKREDCFWRSAMSGGRATVHGTDVRQCGDIASVTPEGHILTNTWYVECKFVRNLRLHGLFDNRESRDSLLGYWIHASADAVRFEKLPMLIAKENAGPILMCVPYPNKGLRAGRLLSVNIPRWDISIYLFDEVLAIKFRRGLLQ